MCTFEESEHFPSELLIELNQELEELTEADCDEILAVVDSNQFSAFLDTYIPAR